MKSNLGPIPLIAAAVLVLGLLVVLFLQTNRSRVIPSNGPYKGGYQPPTASNGT